MLVDHEEILSPAFLGRLRALPEPEDYAAARLLPQNVIEDTVFEYTKGTNNRPVMAQIIPRGTEAPRRPWNPLGEEVAGQIPAIKVKQQMDERVLERIMNPRAGTSDERNAIAEVYNVGRQLVEDIYARFEYMRIKALSEDTLVYDQEGVVFAFDFGIEQTQQFNLVTQTNGAGTSIASDVSTVWSDTANSDWVADLIYMCDLMSDAWGDGGRPAELWIPRAGRRAMMDNDNIRDYLGGTATLPSGRLGIDEVNAVLEKYDLPAIRTYDVIVDYVDETRTRTSTRLLAANKAFLVPSTPVGELLVGPTIEARTALFGTPLASEAPGIWVNSWVDEDPPAEWIKAASAAFPTLPRAELIGQITWKSA